MRRIIAGEKQLYEGIIRRYNQRLYRVARAIVQNQEEAEDVIQDTYTRAFEHLAQFEGRASFSTWLTKIAVYEAWNRMKQCSRHKMFDSVLSKTSESSQTSQTPEHQHLAEETRAILENAIDRLPESYRSVFVKPSLEEMTTSEIAQCLELSKEVVKVRLLRARRILRRTLYEKKVHAASAEAFQFLGDRCDRATSHVLRRLAIPSHARSNEHAGPNGSPAVLN